MQNHKVQSLQMICQLLPTQLKYHQKEKFSQDHWCLTGITMIIINNYPSTRLRKSDRAEIQQEIVITKILRLCFCETKLPQFVRKTNQKVEQLFKQEQIQESTIKKKLLMNSIKVNKDQQKMMAGGRKAQKTNLANCLKEYATLQKLSMFMQNDQNMKQKCLYFQIQKDPSRNLLLDIITHRFGFLKSLQKKTRQNIYRSLLGRADINPLTKINFQDYMRLSEMFVGRDANNIDISTFLYIFLFANHRPTIVLAQDKIHQLNGPFHKKRVFLSQLQKLIEQPSTHLIDSLSTHEKILKLFIDIIIQN